MSAKRARADESDERELLRRAADDSLLLEAVDRAEATRPTSNIVMPQPRYGDESLRVVTRHGELLVKLLVCCVQLGDECTLDFDATGLTVRQLSTSRSTFVELHVPRTSFIFYYVGTRAHSFTLSHVQVRQLKPLIAARHWFEFAARARVEPDRLLARIADANDDILVRLDVNESLDDTALSIDVARYEHAQRVRMAAPNFARLVQHADKVKAVFVNFAPTRAANKMVWRARATSSKFAKQDSVTSVDSMETLIADDVTTDDSYALVALLLVTGFAAVARQVTIAFGRRRATDAVAAPLVLTFVIDAPAKKNVETPFATANAVVAVREVYEDEDDDDD